MCLENVMYVTFRQTITDIIIITLRGTAPFFLDSVTLFQADVRGRVNAREI